MTFSFPSPRFTAAGLLSKHSRGALDPMQSLRYVATLVNESDPESD